MQANAGNMSTGAQVTMSAVIGGTAEKLGGGKFANGAVTGAYVMMFNHLGHEGDGENPQKESSKQKLSLKDKDLPQKLIEEMKVINEKGFKGGHVSDLFDEASLSFGKHESWKSEIFLYENSAVEISIMNPKFGPDYGYYYKIITIPHQRFGRASFGSFDIKANSTAINMKIHNKNIYNKVYDYLNFRR